MEETLISYPKTGNLLNAPFKKDGERVRLDCPKHLKSELKEIWAATVLSKFHLLDHPSLKSRALSLLRSPFSHDCPVIEILIYLVAKEFNVLTPPLVPRSTCLPLFELCQLALLWSIAGFSKEASALAHSILPLVHFPTLWAREEEYDERESALSLSFFSSNGEEKGRDETPFFRAISSLFSGFDVPCSIESFSPEPLFFHTPDIQGALTLLGRGTPLGTFQAKGADVRAFGPQALPLSDSKQFGIERSLKGKDGWTRVFACPEVWLQTKKFFENGLDVRFVGLQATTSLNFSFYIKASSAQIGTSRFSPKNLTRYQGESKPVIFADQFSMESVLPTRMELIPLAGEGCFWGAEFLLTFEIHPVEARGLFQWKNLS
jgi:hypothetical protein